LDRIDLILPAGYEESFQKKINELLPQDARMLPVEARSGSIEQMTSAFRVNLTALSLLALVVGLFLIYNTMTFSVVQRRSLFGTLRCLGVTRMEIFMLVVSEALVVGIIGAFLGSGLGVIMGQGAVRLVTQTINDLFFVVTVQGVQIPLSSLVKGMLLGILATVFTAAPPAWEAASVPPRAALSRSGLEGKARQAVNLAAGLGLLVCLSGALILLFPTSDLVISFVGTFAIVTGFAMLAPMVTLLLARGFVPLSGKIWGSLGRMAPRNAVNSLSRTSIAVAALMVAVSVTIGVSLMVSSFRYTVVLWLEQVLQGDIYISAPSLIATQSSAPINESVIDQLPGFPGVSSVLMLRSVNVDSPGGPVHIAASSNPGVAEERSFLSKDYSAVEIDARMAKGAVVVSESFAARLGLPPHSGVVELYTDQGLHEFPVVGIYYDYASTQGTVLMSLDIYRKYWRDDSITSIALILQPGVDPDQVSIQLRDRLNTVQYLEIRANKLLRAEVMEVFDRTFAITSALQLLATLVAFIGVLSALLSLELERQRELGILRALGLTGRQLWKLIMIETGLLGFVAGLLALPTGYTLSLILVYIINKRSFGWTLQMQVLPEPFIQAMILAVVAALLAGIYPAYRMSKMLAVEAMRFD
jgi:putative ABC transport system permease protein